MPHGKKKNTSGAGSIRKKTVVRNGTEYTYWEARFTTGFDPKTGKQKQRSITGKTQKEVAQKLRHFTAELDSGTYHEPCKMTVGEWLDIWKEEYLVDVKPYTEASYKGVIKNHIKPAIGIIKLDDLDPYTIQSFYNALSTKGLSAKTVKNIHGVLHRALQQAVLNQYIRFNPTDACKLPRIEKKEMHPLDEAQIGAFMQAIKGHRYEILYTVTLFTGLREGEALGLMWNCVDFEKGTILVDKQLQRQKKLHGDYIFLSTKNGKSRTITPASWVMDLLRMQQARQEQARTQAGDLWEDSGLVFTNEVGHHLALHTVYKEFKKIVCSIDAPEVRFHDLRHSYAVASIRAGDDIKTVQGNLGHATASFTLDVYGHVTEQMKQASSARMDAYIKDILKLPNQ